MRKRINDFTSKSQNGSSLVYYLPNRDLFFFLMVTFFAVLHAVRICLPLESLLKALTLT